MLETNIVKIAKERMQIEFTDQRKRLQENIQHCINEIASKNMLNSSRTLIMIEDLCVDAITERVQRIWEILFRFVTTAGVRYSEELATELKDTVKNNIPENLNEFKGLVKRNTQRFGINVGSAHKPRLVDAYRQALAKISNEIDLFVLSLKRHEEIVKTGELSTTINIYSPVGAIQTGKNAVAHVTQYIDPVIKQQIQDILVSLEKNLLKLDSLPHHPKDEIIELVQEGQSEIRKDKPNLTKIKSILSTAAISIQLVDHLKPTYEILKSVLVHLGIPMP